jgi:hypothetical protein
MSRYQEAAQRARAQGKLPPREPAYATASAAFHAFQKEITDLLEQVERQPATEVTITGVQHHLTQEEMDGFNGEGQVVQIEIALETPELETRTGEAKVPEQRLVVYRLKEDGERQWIGVVQRGNAGDAEPGRYQAHLKRRLRKKLKEGQSRYANSLHGTLAPAPVTTASPSPPSEVRRLLISGSRKMDQAGLEYARTLVRHARSRGWEIFVGDNPQGVDAEVIRTAIEEGYDDHLVIYGAYRRCRIKDTGRAKVTLTDGSYTQRDRIMAGRCDAAVGVWNGNSPGTQEAITSAAEMGKHAFLMARSTEGWNNRLPGDDDIFSMEETDEL